MTTYNTGNPIGSTEVKDLYDNAQNFDTLANTTTQETVPDRRGVQRMTLHGFEQEAKRRFESIKFQPPISYAPGIEVTTSSLTVDYLGVIYYALPSALPFTTGPWNPAQWSPVQNTYPRHELLVFDDYAAASAAAATLPDGQVLVSPNQLGRESEFKVVDGSLVFQRFADVAIAPSILDYLQIPDADHTAAFIRAAAANKVVRLPAGDYNIKPFECEPCLFIGEGQGAVRIIASGLPSEEYTVNFLPTLDRNRSFGFDGVSFIAADDGSANDGVVFPAAPLMYDAHVKNVMRNISFTGTGKVAGVVGFAQNFGWRTNFILGDGVSHEVDMIEASGTYRVENDPSPQPPSKLLKLRAHTAMVSARITRIAIYNIRDLAEIGDNAGWFIDQIDQAYGERGIYSTGTRQFGEGIIGTGVLNVQREGVNLSSLGNTLPYGEFRWVRINDISVNRSPSGFDGAWDWVGVKLSNIKQAWIGSLRTDCNGDLWPTALTIKNLSCTSVEGLTATNLKLASRADIPIELIDCPGFLIDNVEFVSQTNNFATFSGASTTGRFGQWAVVGGAISGANRWKFENGATQADLDIFRLHDRPVGIFPARELQKVGATVNQGRWVQTIGATDLLEDRPLDDSGVPGVAYRTVRRSGSDVVEVAYTAPLIGLVGSDTYTRQLRPQTDNAYALGLVDRRWTEVRAANGSIVTSDEREKQQWRAQTEAERAAALHIKDSIRSFKWQSAVSEKGEGARWHFGVGAQTVGDIMRGHGLDPAKYAFWCFDEWEEQPEIKDGEGNITQEYVQAGHRYGIRYNELAMFILAAI